MRKSKKYLVCRIILVVISLLAVAILAYTYFIDMFPGTLKWNILRFIIFVVGLISMFFRDRLKDLEYNAEYEKKGDEKIAKLREKNSNIALVVTAYSKYIYENLPSDLKEEYSIIINKDDGYLLDLDENCNLMHSEIMKDKSEQQFITVACLVDALVSGWKICSIIPNEFAFLDELVYTNCGLACYIAFNLIGLPYCDLNTNYYISKFNNVLAGSYYDEVCGKASTIMYEALILELLYNDFCEKCEKPEK